MPPLPRLPLTPIVAGVGTLSPEAARYLTRVLRLRVGSTFEAFDPRAGLVAEAQIIAIERERTQIAIAPPTPIAAEESPLVLVQGYPKGDKLGDVVRDATELGATAIVPAICARSIARPDEKKRAGKRERLETIAEEAARQSRRARAPSILEAMGWVEALETARVLAKHAFVLWEGATSPIGPPLVRLAAERASIAEGVAFAVGPEGGLTREEVEAAERAGFTIASLGSAILRTETAATAILGAWRVLAGA